MLAQALKANTRLWLWSWLCQRCAITHTHMHDANALSSLPLCARRLCSCSLCSVCGLLLCSALALMQRVQRVRPSAVFGACAYAACAAYAASAACDCARVACHQKQRARVCHCAGGRGPRNRYRDTRLRHLRILGYCSACLLGYGSATGLVLLCVLFVHYV